MTAAIPAPPPDRTAAITASAVTAMPGIMRHWLIKDPPAGIWPCAAFPSGHRCHIRGKAEDLAQVCAAASKARPSPRDEKDGHHQ